MSIINYAIEIETGTAVTDADIACISGNIRIITGRPGYSSTTLYDEDSELVADTWYEGFLTKDGIDEAKRTAPNISITGDYSTESSFTFTMRNDDKLWNLLETNDIYLINKEITYYVIIDDVFYYAWNGIITSITYNDIEYRIVCGDKFTKIHTKIPQIEINETTFPDASEDSRGEYIPITMGDCVYAKVINTDGLSKYVKVSEINGQDIYAAAIRNDTGLFYFQNSAGTNITLYYPNRDYFDNFYDTSTAGYGNYYLVAVAGTGSDSTKYVPIHYVVTTPTSVQFILHAPVPGLQTAIENGNAVGYSDAPTSETWYFVIAKLSSKYVVSQNEIVDFSKNAGGRAKLFSYDKKYIDISHNSRYYKPNVKLPYVSATNNGLITDGTISTYSFYPPEDVLWQPHGNADFISHDGGGNAITQLTDRNRYTYLSDSWGYLSGAERIRTTGLLLKIPQEIIDSDVDEIYVLLDITMSDTPDPPHGDMIIGIRNCRILDSYAHVIDEDLYTGSDTTISWAGSSIDIAAGKQVVSGGYNIEFYTIPDYYYITSGNDFTDNSDFAKTQTITNNSITSTIYPPDTLSIETDSIEKVRNGYYTPYLQLAVDAFIPAAAPSGWFSIRQATFMVAKRTSIVAENIFASISGEYYGGYSGNETNNVYATLKHLMETYDEISNSDIDYGNLSTRRNSWYTARQLSEQKNSYTYLKEICKHSFVVGYPDRKGNRAFSAWIEDTTSVDTHDESEIINGTLGDFNRTPYHELYNNFSIKYNYLNGINKYANTIKVAKLDETAFPAIDTDTNSDGVLDWQEYVTGIDAGSYADAKLIWERAHNTYLRVGTLNELPSDLSELPWFYDSKDFDSTDTTSTGTSSSAWKFLENCIGWTARNKITVEYRLPITGTHIVRDISDRITINDRIKTNNTDLGAWIFSVSIDAKNNEIVVEAIIEPDAVDQLDTDYPGDINETGSASDTITESGTQTDTITEGA